MKVVVGAAFAVVFFALVPVGTRAATDPEIDRLLKKLPAPEKLVKADPRALRVNDPVFRDPLIPQITEAARRKQMKRGAELTGQLAARYPNSAPAQTINGIWAMELKRYGAASAAFRRSIQIQPQFVIGHFYLAASEFEQTHYAAALPHIRRVTQLEPNAAAAWVFLSVCAEAAGRAQESLVAAKRCAVLAPSQVASWVRLAKAHQAVGNYGAAHDAMARAFQVERASRGAAKPRKR